LFAHPVRGFNFGLTQEGEEALAVPPEMLCEARIGEVGLGGRRQPLRTFPQHFRQHILGAPWPNRGPDSILCHRRILLPLWALVAWNYHQGYAVFPSAPVHNI
jgi:hypothetical protein